MKDRNIVVKENTSYLYDTKQKILKLEQEISILKSRSILNDKMISIFSSNINIMVTMVDITCVEAKSNYSIITFRNHKPVMVTKTLKYWEQYLDKNFFIRCHRSFLINRNEIKILNKSERRIILKDDKMIPISRSRKKIVISKLYLELD